MSVLVATAYMEEAESFDWLIAMDAGRVLASRLSAGSQGETRSTTIEEVFIAFLPEERRRGRRALEFHRGRARPRAGYRCAATSLAGSATSQP